MLENNNTQFTCVIDGNNFKSLTDFVHKMSRDARCPFSAEKTQKYRKTYTYKCTFSQNGCFAKLAFTRFEDFFKNSFFSFDTQESFFHHCNHPVIQRFAEAHRNCVNQETIEQIQFQTKLGVLPGRIRTNLDLECGSDKFYEIRRPILKEDRIEDIEELLESLHNGKRKLVTLTKNEDILESLTILDKEILESNYSSDIAIIDDTSMTNMYGLPIEAMLVVDQEDHSQLLGYSVLPNKSKESFENFFNDYIKLGGKSFRIIIVDRLEAQYSSIVKVFPQTYIVFCLVHIRKDLRLYFNQLDHEILNGFDEIRKNPFKII